jgi:hypothetical protein
MKKQYNEDKEFTLTLTQEQISVIKAGLQYYWLADDYGYALWGTMPGACFGSSDILYSRKVGIIYENLNKLTKVKPNYGWWGNIKRIAELCKKDYEIAKKEGEEAERAMYEECLQMEIFTEQINKYGLDGHKIVREASDEFRKRKEADEYLSKQSKKQKR